MLLGVLEFVERHLAHKWCMICAMQFHSHIPEKHKQFALVCNRLRPTCYTYTKTTHSHRQRDSSSTPTFLSPVSLALETRRCSAGSNSQSSPTPGTSSCDSVCREIIRADPAAVSTCWTKRTGRAMKDWPIIRQGHCRLSLRYDFDIVHKFAAAVLCRFVFRCNQPTFII